MESINVPENWDKQQFRKGKFLAPQNYGKITLEAENLKPKILTVVGSDASMLSELPPTDSDQELMEEVLDGIDQKIAAFDDNISVADISSFGIDVSKEAFKTTPCRTKIKNKSSVQMDNQPIIWNLDLEEVLDNIDENIGPAADTVLLDDESSPSLEVDIAPEDDIKSTPSLSGCSPLIKNCYVKMDNQPINWNLQKVVLPSGAKKLKYTRYKCCEEDKEDLYEQPLLEIHDVVQIPLDKWFETNVSQKLENEVDEKTAAVHEDEVEEVSAPNSDTLKAGKRLKRHSKQFIEDALEMCDSIGVMKTAEKMNVSRMNLTRWRRNMGKESWKKRVRHTTKFKKEVLEHCGKRLKRHSQQFIEDALKMCDSIGVMKTAEKLNVSRMNLTRWRKNMGKESQKKRVRHTTEFKKEVLDHYSHHGSKATIGEYDSIDNSKICKWKKQYGVDPTIHSSEEVRFRLEVLDYCKENGLKAASDKFKVPLPTIWDWKAKEKKKMKNPKRLKNDIVQGYSKDLKNETIKEYSEELKNEIVMFYKEHGSKACEVKFKVPRQTVRNWAVNMGQATIGEKRVEHEKLEALQLAKKEGVQKAMSTFPVKRATLYHWAKNMNAEIRDGENNSIEVSVAKEGHRKKLVFGRVEKPKKVKEKKPRIPKPKKVKQAKPIEEVNSVELPDWAASFIKKAKTTSTVNGDCKGIGIPGLQIEESLLASSDFETINCDVFSMTIPVIQTPLLDTPSSQDRGCSDSSSESEYECNDYSDFSFPFFSPSLHQNVSASSASLDPPTMLRKRRFHGQTNSA